MSKFRSESSISDFCKIIKHSHCDFETDSNQNNHLSGRHVADESDYKWSRNSQGYIDFTIAEPRLCYKSAEICSEALAKDRVSRVENRLSQNDITTNTEKRTTNLRMTLWQVTSLACSLCSTAQTILSAMLHIRCLQQQQIAAIRSNPSYQSAMYLNQDSTQERKWWFNNLETCNAKLIVSPTSKTVIQLYTSKKGWGGVLSESVDRWSVDSPGVKPPYQCSGIVSH